MLSFEDAISLLVIEKNEGVGLGRFIVSALREVNSATMPGYRLLNHIAHSWPQMKEVAPNTRVDFVVVAMDVRVNQCMEWTEQILGELPARLLARRTLLVNAAGLQYYDMGNKLDTIRHLEEVYRLDTMSADVSDHRQCTFLARRIITYVEESLGCISGIPNIHSYTHNNMQSRGRHQTTAEIDSDGETNDRRDHDEDLSRD